MNNIKTVQDLEREYPELVKALKTEAYEKAFNAKNNFDFRQSEVQRVAELADALKNNAAKSSNNGSISTKGKNKSSNQEIQAAALIASHFKNK